MLSISFAPVLVRLAQGTGVPSLLIAGSRLILAALFLTPLALRAENRARLRALTRRDFFLATVSGMFLALHFAAWVTSLEYTSVLLSVVFVTSSPLWVAILEFLFLQARLPRLVVIGLLIAVSGGLLIGFAGQSPDLDTISTRSDLIGGGLSLIGAVAVAVYLIIGRKLRENMPLIPYVWLVYGCAGLILMLAVFVTGIPLTGYPADGYLWLLAMAIFPQLIGHSSLNYAVAYLPATLVSMVTQLEPIGSAILAYILFNELPLPLQILGSGIILCGVMLANLGQARKRRQKPAPSTRTPDTPKDTPS
jgi:drug/metabolite transporter (DMT)-like permease